RDDGVCDERVAGGVVSQPGELVLCVRCKSRLIGGPKELGNVRIVCVLLTPQQLAKKLLPTWRKSDGERAQFAANLGGLSLTCYLGQDVRDDPRVQLRLLPK